MGKWTIPLHMTHNKKLNDLLYFKGKIDDRHININLTENIEIDNNFKIMVSIYS